MFAHSLSKKISISEIRFSSKSMVDDFGRVFFYDNRVFRLINDNKTDYCLQLLKSPLFQELSNRGLIAKTWIADFCIEDCELVLEHEKLTETLQHEWSFSMLKDAALLVLEIQLLCLKHGYELKDAHTLNVLFRGTQAIYIDIGSIVKKKTVDSGIWVAYEEFLASFVLPLLFWEKKMNYIVRKLLESNFYRMVTIPEQPITSSGLLKLLFNDYDDYTLRLRQRSLLTTKKKVFFLSLVTEKAQAALKKITGRNTQLFSYQRENTLTGLLSSYLPFTKILSLLNSLQVPRQESVWSGYHTRYYSANGELTPSKRFLRIIEIIKVLASNIESLIDLAGNEGFVSKLIVERTSISKLILADYDENAVDSAFLSLRESGVQRINAVLLNFMFTPNIETTANRLRCDLVLALAVTHHLVLSAGFSLPCVLERLAMFSNRYVIVEFMPLGLWSESCLKKPEIPDWYNVVWFRLHFEKKFIILIEEQIEKNRILFVGELRKNNEKSHS